MKPPKNSADVAVALWVKAKQLGLRAKMESSLVTHSDSRYVIINPGAADESVIRISSHAPYEERYGICLSVKTPDALSTAIAKGIEWIEEHYDPNSSVFTGRPKVWSAAAAVHHQRRGGSGHPFVGGRPTGTGTDQSRKNRASVRRPRRVRNTGQVQKWTSSEARRVRDEWDRDD